MKESPIELVNVIEEGLKIISEIDFSENETHKYAEIYFDLNRISVGILNLIKSGADPNTSTDQGFDALYFAIKSSDLYLMTFLIRSGAKCDVSYKNCFGFTPIHLAVASQDGLIIFGLLTVLRDENLFISPEILELRDASGKTPLHYAASIGNLVASQALMIEGANPDFSDSEGNKIFTSKPSGNSNSKINLQVAQKISEYKKNAINPAEASGAIRRIEFALCLEDFYRQNQTNITYQTRTDFCEAIKDSAYITFHKILDDISVNDPANAIPKYEHAARLSLELVHNLVMDFAKSRYFFDRQKLTTQNLQIAQQILKDVTLILISNYKVKADLASKFGYTALHFACYLKDQELYDSLIKLDGNVGKKNKLGIAPSYYLSKKTLVGDDNSKKLSSHKTTETAKKSDTDSILSINELYKIELNKIYNVILDYRKLLEVSNNRSYQIRIYPNLNKINDLLLNGADHSLSLENGVDACYIAVIQKNRKLLYNLIERKADFSKLYYDQTLLHIFFESPDLSSRDSDIFIILLHLLRNKNFVIDEKILNKQDENGDTIVHLAVKKALQRPECQEFLKILISESPNIFIQNKENKIPQKIPPKNRRHEVFEILEHYRTKLEDQKVFAFSIINLGRVIASNCNTFFREEEFYFKKEVLEELMKEAIFDFTKSTQLNVGKKATDLSYMMNILVKEIEVLEQSIEIVHDNNLDNVLGLSEIIYDYERLISQISKVPEHQIFSLRRKNREKDIFGIKKLGKKSRALVHEEILESGNDSSKLLPSEVINVENPQQTLQRILNEYEEKIDKKHRFIASDFYQLISLLEKEEAALDIDFNVCTPRHNNLLMLLVKANQVDLVEKILVRIDGEISLKNDQNESVITLINGAEKDKKFGMFDIILGSEKLSRELILEDLPRIHQLKDAKFAARIFKIENLIQKVVSADFLDKNITKTEDEQRQILQELNKSRANFLKILRENFPSIRVEIAKFENSLDQEAQKLPKLKNKKDKTANPEERSIKISERKALQIAQKEKLAQLFEIEEMTRAERQTRGFYRAEAKLLDRENSGMNYAEQEIIKTNSEELNLYQKIRDEIIETSLDEDYHSLVTEILQCEKKSEEIRQMRDFLSGSRIIDSIADLPKFLRSILLNLMESDCAILLKGSAIFPKKDENERIPVDLDIEILIPKIGDNNDQYIENFFSEKFGIKLDHDKIYRGNNRTNSVFSVNIKDETRLLDISLYDTTRMPPKELSWISNYDRKITFDQHQNAIVLNAVGEKILDEKEKFDPQFPLILNSKARDLILRMSFFEIKSNVVNRDAIKNAILALDLNPRELILKEFRLDRRNENPISQQLERVINHYVESHDLNEQERQRFITNILYFSDSKRPFKIPEEASIFRELKKVLESFVQPKTENISQVTASHINSNSVQKNINLNLAGL